MILKRKVDFCCQGYRWFSLNARLFSAMSDTPSNSQLNSTFRTSEPYPANHGALHEGRFYTVPNGMQKQLFSFGGLPKKFLRLSETLNELSIMVRKPSVEVINHLKATNFAAPANRYVLYGKPGTGKSLTLAHVLHYGASSDFVLIHVPWVPNWFRRFKEITPSAQDKQKYDHPIESVEWLRHFASQNSALLQKLQLNTTQTYTWSKRESTPEGAYLGELIDLGLNRAKYATGCVAALLDELKKAATQDKCRCLVVIDGFNAFFSTKTRATREDKSMLLPSDFALTDSFLSITRNDWNNAAIVVSVDLLAHPTALRQSHLPRYQLGKEGFEHLDPFIPIEVSNYNDRELNAQIDYFIERNWLQQPKAHTASGREELSFTSGNNPFELMKIIAPY
uniref:Small ribosomal subunit protein mS29 n=1 Tax=Moina brachiata TaxID=675436 RepID=A0A4Y7NIF2_9CRUS|nr:EOG090X05V1 [Moina brachiata]SVE93001.1 EOG090X05V1 [Moina brachiata]